MSDYDNPIWWEKREFEHKAESAALSRLLELIEKRRNVIDIGAGFGRLTPIYAPFFSKITLVDPSDKLLVFAENYLQNMRGIDFVHGRIEKLPAQDSSYDVALCIRVVHLFENLEEVLPEISRVLKDGGYLILEFSPKDHNPRSVYQLLTWSGFDIQKILSVSNIRFSILKKFIPTALLMRLEDKIQEPLARFHTKLKTPKVFFRKVPYLGESIFLLAQKTASNEPSLLKSLEI